MHPYCANGHAALKADRRLANDETEGAFDWPAGARVLCMATCVRCRSTICLRVAVPVVAEVAA